MQSTKIFCTKNDTAKTIYIALERDLVEYENIRTYVVDSNGDRIQNNSQDVWFEIDRLAPTPIYPAEIMSDYIERVIADSGTYVEYLSTRDLFEVLEPIEITWFNQPWKWPVITSGTEIETKLDCSELYDTMGVGIYWLQFSLYNAAAETEEIIDSAVLILQELLYPDQYERVVL